MIYLYEDPDEIGQWYDNARADRPPEGYPDPELFEKDQRPEVKAWLAAIDEAVDAAHTATLEMWRKDVKAHLTEQGILMEIWHEGRYQYERIYGPQEFAEDEVEAEVGNIQENSTLVPIVWPEPPPCLGRQAHRPPLPGSDQPPRPRHTS